jgi:hypothetical protein
MKVDNNDTSKLGNQLRRGVNFSFFSQTVCVGSNFAKIEKAKLKILRFQLYHKPFK